MQNFFSKMLPLVAVPLVLMAVVSAQTPSAAPAAPSSAPAKPATAAKKPATAAKPATTLTLKTQKEKASYAVGMSIGSGLHRQALPVDPALVARGLRDAMTGAKSLLTDAEMKAVLTQLQTDFRQAQEAKQHEAGSASRKAGEDFLAANKGKEGVVTLPSGMEYKILTQGNGPKPTATDTVSCQYRGTLINGKEFDSSYKHGSEPISFPVNGVIKGWTEALQMMPVGSKWQLFIPADMAYGDRGAPPDIGPGETLIFEVELVSIGEPKKDDQKPEQK